MNLSKVVEMSEFWELIDCIVNEGEGVEITIGKHNFAISAEAYTLDGDPAGFTVYNTLDGFMASLLNCMCNDSFDDKNYRVKMLDDNGISIPCETSEFIDGGGDIVFTITNENKVN